MLVTRRILTTLAFASALAVVPSPSLAQEKLKVAASFSILADMVERIGGDHVEVISFVGPNEDAHAFTPTPADAAKLADAKLFVVNGLGFEGWLGRLTEAVAFKGKTVVASDGIKAREMAEEQHGEEQHGEEQHGEEQAAADHDGHDSHDHGETDPHAWQSLKNGIVYARNIATALCDVDSQNCNQYRGNAEAYEKDMQSLDAEIRKSVEAIPAARRKVITTHDAFGYFGDAYGISFLAPQGITTETEASAQAVAGLIKQIKTDNITALFLENMSDTRLLQQIARETQVKAGGELFADALDEKGKPAGTYLGMMRHNIEQLAPAMAGS